MKKIAISLLFVFLLAGNTRTQEYQVRGVIHDIPQIDKRKAVTIHVYLLTESTFKKPYKGIREIEIEVKPGQNLAPFAINDVKPGVYGLRCYLDENNTNELDKFLMVPQESWCLSWKDNEISIPPKFEDVSFKVQEDLRIDLYLSQ